MKFNISKEWCEKSANLEDGCEVGAGIPPQFRPKPKRLPVLWWKLRYALEMYRVARMSLRDGWGSAGAWLEMVNGDLTEATPKEAVETEISYWDAE